MDNQPRQPANHDLGPGRTEFIVLIATVSALTAFSIDAMLPALTVMGNDLSPETPQYAQFVITSFMLGMGLGTLFVGPLADRFGRRPVLLTGVAIYLAASFFAYQSQSLAGLLTARFIMGLGTAGPRIVSQAIVRDRFVGREMAQITSFIMMVFAVVPAMAPFVGAMIIEQFGWRSIFVAFMIFALAVSTWFAMRQPETLAPENRRPLSLSALWEAVTFIFQTPMSRLAITAQAFSFAMLIIAITTTQPVFEQTFGKAESFPTWFAVIALMASSASFINARLVPKLGMRHIVIWSLSSQIVITIAVTMLFLIGLSPEVTFWIYVIWIITVFFQVGLTLGNLSALAMEPLGHIAGAGSSVMMAVSTVAAVLIGSPAGLLFDGSPVPIFVGVIICSTCGALITKRIARPQTR